MIRKILVANRGEIACRIIRSAQKMGIATVAVYSDADKDSKHVEMADEIVHIGPAPSAESYLLTDKIVEACKKTGADALHPGYGFLSENSNFAETLHDNDLIFIGPGPNAITAMGDKIASKELAKKAGVNTIPGFDGAIEDAAQAVKVANEVGYPVMLKASAGGGGKGMRIARSDDECKDGFERARNEAKSSFGDDRILIEKYIESPRHIEIQIIADSHGKTLYLGERECSLQRRHQKVIEECPSPFLDDKTRKLMGEQAVTLASAVDYQSAGTVEFIVDADKNFYFLEMNTRLQVEHPVTEMVTGYDLVELMIKIAAGEKLPFDQDDVKLTGWSIESRIYAEDPLRNFLPSTGRLSHFILPELSENVRVDTGVTEGDEVSIYYDPMIAKLITYGKTRHEAITEMRSALDQFYIRGVSHNISFLSALMYHHRFVSGDIATNMIGNEYPDGFHSDDLVHDDPSLLVAVAASVNHRYHERAATICGQSPGLKRTVNDSWVVLMNGGSFLVNVTKSGNGSIVTCDGDDYEVISDWNFGAPLFKGEVNGESVCLEVERRDITFHLTHRGSKVEAIVLSERAAKLHKHMIKKEAPDMSKFLLSPMPGMLIKLNAKEGDAFKIGEELAVVEAMKMENSLVALRDCVVKTVSADVGASLTVDQIIVEFE